MKSGLSVNRLAWKLLEKFLKNPDFYGAKIERNSSGVTLVDAGINAKGGFQAGKIITEICMGGCGKAEIISGKYGEVELPTICVCTDHPVIATLGSQFAGWQIKEGEYFAIGSGPARALALKPKEIYAEIGYRDDSDKAVLVLETDRPPSEAVTGRLMKDCHVSPENLVIVLTPTASVAGSTQVSGRIVETGIHKLRKIGFNPDSILYAFGCAPIPPVHPKFAKAMARTNDAILYGGTSYYIVKCDNDEELARIVEQAPSKASKSYGRPFIEILKEVDYDFYKIDPELFAPAVIIMNNVKTGTTFRSGEINTEALRKSFGLKIS
ncbi:MAG: methenyltetrahydromethanopterin cyclohydrolase [Candidatus Bathycorpusculaceae bacterium]